MQIEYFRSSSIGTYRLCQFQYFLNYILGYPDQPVNNKADMGTAFHKVMEILAVLKQRQQNNQELTYEDDAIGLVGCNDLFNNNFIEDITRASSYYYAKKSMHFFTDEDHQKIRRSVYKILDTKFDPRLCKIVAPEGQFNIELKKPEFQISPNQYLRLKGTIDLVIENEDGMYELVDWKHGARKCWEDKDCPVKTPQKLLTDRQLRLYHYVLQKYLYPDKDFLITINFVNDGGAFTSYFPPEYIEQTESYLKDLFDHIQNNDNPRRVNDWRCRAFCHYGRTRMNDGKTMCQHYHDLLKVLGMEETCRLHTRPGHSLGYYEAPG